MLFGGTFQMLGMVATPLHNGVVTRPYDLNEHICIRELGPIRWDVAIIKSHVSEHDREELASTKFWLCAIRNYEHLPDDVGRELFPLAHAAALTLQTLCPNGAKHVFLAFHETPQGWDNVGGSQPDKPLCRTLLGRITDLEEQAFPRDFNAVYEGIRRANDDGLVRLQNPVQLLEHGMQTGHPYIATMLFVAGLDVLVMAGESRTFVPRLGGFLGPETLLFPAESLLHRQPRTTVRDVLHDVYTLRSKVAHGQEIPKTPFRELYRLLSTAGEQINAAEYSYAHLMLDASLFLLTKALHRIFTEERYDTFQNITTWRQQLTIFEHRYNQAVAI
jgi:hypothetical protein